MAYRDPQIEEIKQRLDLVEVIREYIPLQQAGGNWRARCPFHNEKTPSFMISKEKQIWKCFGCGKGGDVFGFVKEIEGLEFPEALRLLAQKAGVILKRQDPQMISARTRLLDLMSEAAEFFVEKLNAAGFAAARRYLDERGLTSETLKEWKIGFAPDEWEALGRHLKSKGFSDSQILASGMAVSKTGSTLGSAYYDRFRERIMFPIFDVNGNAVGFSGRILIETEKSGGKYINTPQTMLYDKSRVVFGLDRAKQEIRKRDLAVVVEGQMDVITSHQAGVKNVAASSGTALTVQQIELIARYTKNLSFCFDMDAAGAQATRRGIDLARQAGMDVKIIRLAGVKDPDECVKTQGAEAWQKCVDEAVPIMEYYFDLIFGQVDVGKIEGRRKAAREFLAEVVKIIDKIEQDYWLKKLAEKVGVDERILREAMRGANKKREYITYREESTKVTKNTKDTQFGGWQPEDKPRVVVLGERVMACALKFPETIDFWTEGFDLEMFNDKSLIELAKNLILHYNQIKSKQRIGKGFDELASEFKFNEFKESLEKELQDYADVLVMTAERDFSDLSAEEIEQEAKVMIYNLKKETIVNQLRGIEANLKEVESRGDKRDADTFSQQLEKLIGELQTLERGIE